MLAYEITIYIFLSLAILIFFKFLFWGDTEDKKLQKIFGGILILITALLSRNGWVVSIAIFISGLIVASEDFMRFLAAVMRTSGDRVADTVRALQAQKASPKEIEEKLQKEGKELEIKLFDNVKVGEDVGLDNTDLEIGPAPTDGAIKTSSERVRERAEKIKQIEILVQPYLKEKFTDHYESHMKITNGTKSLVVDGIVRKNNKIELIIEIKYLTVKSFSVLKYLIIGFREKLLKIGIKRRVLLIVVSEAMTKEHASDMYKDNKGFANLLFFKLLDNHLEIVKPFQTETSE